MSGDGAGALGQIASRVDHHLAGWLAAVAVACGVFSLWTNLELGGMSGVRWFDDLALLAASAWAGVECLRTSRESRSARYRVAWLFLGASGLAWALGQAAWSWYQLVRDTAVPFPGLADVGYVAQMPLAMVGVVAFMDRGGGLSSSIRVVLDGLIIAAAMLFLGWSYFLGEAVDASSGSTLTRVVALSYPIGYVAIGSVVVFVVAQQRHHPGLTLLCVGLGVLAVTSGAYTKLSLDGTFYTGHPIDVGWLAAFSLVAVAARRARWSPAPPEPTDPAPSPMSLEEVAIPYAPVIAAALTTLARGGRIGPFLVLDGVLIVVLLVLRQLLALRENATLNAQLESRVIERTAALERSEQRFAAVVAQSTDMCILIDAAGGLSYVAPQRPRSSRAPTHSTGSPSRSGSTPTTAMPSPASSTRPWLPEAPPDP